MKKNRKYQIGQHIFIKRSLCSQDYHGTYGRPLHGEAREMFDAGKIVLSGEGREYNRFTVVSEIA